MPIWNKTEKSPAKAKGYLKQLVKGHAHMEQDREEPSQSTQALPKINVILKGTSVR
jgi:hypothetical protein